MVVQPHRWHCHEAARAEADLSVLGILRRIKVARRSDGVKGRERFGMSTEEDLGNEASTSSDRRAYMRSIRYNQKTTPCIKWREKIRETQLSVISSTVHSDIVCIGA